VNADDHRAARESGRAGFGHLEGPVTDGGGAPSTDGAPRLRLRPSIEVLFAADGDLYLLRPGTEPDVAIRDPAAGDRELITRLSSGPIAATDQARERVRSLIEAGLVIVETPSPPLDPHDAERFARQLPYLAELGEPATMQRRLRSSTVVVLGCGGLGTWVLGAIACVGVGRVVIIDDDSVELSNLNRQILYRSDDIGRPKVDRAAGWLAAFDPAIDVVVERARVLSPDDLEAPLDGADALVLAADWPPYDLARWVNAACVRARVPFIGAGQQPPLLRVGPLYVHDGGPCFECHEQGLRRAFPLYDEVTAQRRASGGPMTTLGPASGVVGTLVAMELMHLLTTGEASTSGRALLIDMQTLAPRFEVIERDPECAVCAGGAW
jgi:bacteriocin biosynthesis cyclodehydratase domain-containing protein